MSNNLSNFPQINLFFLIHDVKTQFKKKLQHNETSDWWKKDKTTPAEESANILLNVSENVLFYPTFRSFYVSSMLPVSFMKRNILTVITPKLKVVFIIFNMPPVILTFAPPHSAAEHWRCDSPWFLNVKLLRRLHLFLIGCWGSEGRRRPFCPPANVRSSRSPLRMKFVSNETLWIDGAS